MEAIELRKIHLEITEKLQRHNGAVEFTSDGGWFRFPRRKTMYNPLLLNDLRENEIIDDQNCITDKGRLWILMNEVFRS